MRWKLLLLFCNDVENEHLMTISKAKCVFALIYLNHLTRIKNTSLLGTKIENQEEEKLGTS